MKKFWEWMGFFGWNEKKWLEDHDKRELIGYMMEYLMKINPWTIEFMGGETINKFYNKLKKEINQIK